MFWSFFDLQGLDGIQIAARLFVFVLILAGFCWAVSEATQAIVRRVRYRRLMHREQKMHRGQKLK